MKITKLMLFRNRKLNLLNEETFQLEPTTGRVILMGISGSGKSTILSELSPLPSRMRDYYDGGYKEIHIEKDGKKYILTSSGSGAGDHSFLVNGNELNTGNTLTVQYQLVEEHFGYTKEIHAVLLGKERFTQMSGNSRRNWFSTMSKTDSDFISKLWQAINSGKRDIVGALKNNANKISEHTRNLTSTDEIVKLKNNVKAMSNLAKELELMSAMNFIKPDTFTSGFDVLKDAYASFINLANQFYQHSATIDKYNIRAPEDVEALLNRAKGSLDNVVGSIKQKEQMYDEIHQKIANYKSSSMLSQDKVEVDNQIKLLAGEIDSLQLQLQNNQAIYVANFQEGTKDFSVDYILGQLKNILDNFDFTTHGRDFQGGVCHCGDDFTKYANMDFDTIKHQHDSLVFKVKSGETTKATLEEKIKTINERIEEIKNHTCTYKCKNCGGEMTDPIADERIVKLEAKRKEFIERIEQGDVWMKDANLQISNLVKLMSNIEITTKLFLDSRSSHFIMKMIGSFHDSLSRNGSINVLFDNRTWKVNHHVADLNIHHVTSYLYKYIRLTNERDKLVKMLEKMNDGIPSEIAQAMVDETRLSEEIEKLIESKKNISQFIGTLGDIAQLINHINDSMVSIDKHCNAFKEHEKQKIDKEEREALRKCLAIISEEIEELSKIIERHNGLETIIEHLNQDQTNLTRQNEIHDELIKLLNPKDGLIAKSLIGFVRQYISDMNSIISQVWGYSFSIDIEDDENFTKKYEFPVVIEGERSSQDISDTSTGQSEIIDFAFKTIMMKYLGLQPWVYYIDELGGNLNVEYRNNLFNFIKRAHDDGKVKQLFIVTHLSDITNQINNADVITLM